MVQDDRQRISDLNLLSPSERQQVLVQFNQTKRAYPSGRLIHELFEEQVMRTPQAVALSHEGRELSYAELNAHANRLAHHLIALGVQADDRVAICMERGLDLVVALLGVLKAGAAYVPLDPGYPALRLAHMLEDSAPRVLLTQDEQRERLPAISLQPLYYSLQQNDPLIAAQSPLDPDVSARGVEPSNLAYVIYTSGSTGVPKGVMIEHRGVVNFLTAMARELAITDNDVLLAVTTFAFDIAGLELYLPLTQGARVVLATRADAQDPQALGVLIERHGVTIMQATPATWRMLLAHGWAGRRSFRALCGGEALSSELAAQLAARVDAAFNLYGPTETTIWSTVAKIETGRHAPIACIGRPIANTQVYILDPRRQPVPIGVGGELYIGGASVARGYWERPELTAERFVYTRFGSDAAARLYRTGDLGRWLPDGTLEFLQRNDNQVKLRGYRVELGEIEARLSACAGVREAVVLAREDTGGDKRLVAYVTSEPGVQLSAAQLRSELSGTLAEYMVPVAYVFLDALPLSANGKLDRRALPAPDHTAAVMREYQAPQPGNESTIAGIWQSLLHLPRVGRHDNFFELGGHSLLVLKFLTALKAEYSRRIPVAWVFQAPTPAQLAALMNADHSARNWKHLVPLHDRGERSPLFCLNGFEGNVNDYLNIANFIDPSVPIYGLEVGSDAAGDFEVLDTRIESYLREIRGVQPRGPYRVCGFSFGGSEAFDVATRLEQEGDQVLLILLDAYRPSKLAVVHSWLPRIVRMIQKREVLLTVKRKLRNLFVHHVRRWVTGTDTDLSHALGRRAMQRQYRSFSGQVVLFKSTGFEDWAFQPRMDGYNGWKNVLKGKCEVIQLQAGHAAMMKKPSVIDVVHHLNAILCE
jgi:amino acid adenylation domain-containing protein